MERIGIPGEPWGCSEPHQHWIPELRPKPFQGLGPARSRNVVSDLLWSFRPRTPNPDPIHPPSA